MSSDAEGDPLAMTFTVTPTETIDGIRGTDAVDGGCFLTSVDLYFGAKDNQQPVWIELRNVINGYPGPKILPFGRKLLQAADINTSTDASTATTFTFDSPVFVKEGQEYCIVIRTHSPEPAVWISQMGQTDVGGTRIISKQPHLGVLFKSQNNYTWTAIQSEDLKFTVKKASFDTSKVGALTLQNKIIGESVTNELGTTVYGKRLNLILSY